MYQDETCAQQMPFRVHQSQDQALQDIQLEEDTTAFVQTVVEGLPASPTLLQRIQDQQQQDPTCSSLIEYTTSGWPEPSKLSRDTQPYYTVAGELTVNDNLLMRGSRIVIPTNLREELLGKIHAGHLGIQKCLLRAQESVWWPGITRDIHYTVEHCGTCIKQRPNPVEPLLPSPPSDRPWQKVATDLFEWNGATYLLVVDYFSRYPEMCKLTSTTSTAAITHLKSIFARHGIPETVMSDNGPQYCSAEFKTFANAYGFHHITSSPHFAQSNGAVERCVKTIKALLTKADDAYIALMEYRATPIFNGFSPAQLLMSRQIRTTLPILPSTLTPKVPDPTVVRAKEVEYKKKMKAAHDQRHRAQALPPLQPGDTVYVKDTPGTIHQSTSTPRSYIVATEKGTIRRNRRNIQRAQPAAETPQAAPETPQRAENTEAEPRRNPARSRNQPAHLKDFVL